MAWYTGDDVSEPEPQLLVLVLSKEQEKPLRGPNPSGLSQMSWMSALASSHRDTSGK